MIGKLRGIVDSVDEDGLILDVGGVGYLVAASARTLRSLPAPGEPANLLIETYVREDAIRLYGFLTVAERDWFRRCRASRALARRSRLAFSAR